MERKLKLQDAIIIGRFMGLQSVEECYYNAELHYFSTLPFNEAHEERAELVCEMSLYNADYLGIDWDKIDKEIDRQEKEFIEYCENNPVDLVPGLDDEILEGWRNG